MNDEHAPDEDTPPTPVDALGNPMAGEDTLAGELPANEQDLMTPEEIREYMKESTVASPEQKQAEEIHRILKASGVTEEEAEDFRKAVIMDKRFSVEFTVMGDVAVVVRSRTMAEQRAVLAFGDSLRRSSEVTTQMDLNEALKAVSLLVQIHTVDGAPFGDRYGLCPTETPTVDKLREAYAKFTDTTDTGRFAVLADCLEKFTLKELALRKALALPDFWRTPGPGR